MDPFYCYFIKKTPWSVFATASVWSEILWRGWNLLRSLVWFPNDYRNIRVVARRRNNVSRDSLKPGLFSTKRNSWWILEDFFGNLLFPTWLKQRNWKELKEKLLNSKSLLKGRYDFTKKKIWGLVICFTLGICQYLFTLMRAINSPLKGNLESEFVLSISG